jgi:hypothetical protein
MSLTKVEGLIADGQLFLAKQVLNEIAYQIPKAVYTIIATEIWKCELQISVNEKKYNKVAATKESVKAMLGW